MKAAVHNSFGEPIDVIALLCAVKVHNSMSAYTALSQSSRPYAARLAAPGSRTRDYDVRGTLLDKGQSRSCKL